jgi:hypothetical protein
MTIPVKEDICRDIFHKGTRSIRRLFVKKEMKTGYVIKKEIVISFNSDFFHSLLNASIGFMFDARHAG